MPLNRYVRTYGRRAERKGLESAARSKARRRFEVEAMGDVCPSLETDGGDHFSEPEGAADAAESARKPESRISARLN